MPLPVVKEEVKARMDDPVIQGEPEEKKSEVSVDLDAEGKIVKPVEKPKDEPKYFDPKEVEKITENAVKKATAPLYYELRQLKEKKESPSPIRREEVPQDEWDIKVQKDWKGTVQELAEKRYKELRQAELRDQQVYQAQQQKVQLLEQNKRRVMEKHPELDDATSDKARIFQEVIQKNPDYVYNEFGPVLAMREMEDELRKRGIVDEPTRNIVDKEVQRQTRTNATSVRPGQQTTGVKKHIMSASDKEFCDLHKIKYETFISNQQRMSKSEGVEA